MYLLPEVDGLRIIGNDMHEFLQRVPCKPTSELGLKWGGGGGGGVMGLRV